MTVDRGAATIVTIALVVIVTIVGLGTAAVGVLFAAWEKTTISAEASALAAAVATYPPAATDSPRQAAIRVAAANHTNLRLCVCRVDGSMSERQVEVHTSLTVHLPVLGAVTVVGRARAQFAPRDWLGR